MTLAFLKSTTVNQSCRLTFTDHFMIGSFRKTATLTSIHVIGEKQKMPLDPPRKCRRDMVFLVHVCLNDTVLQRDPWVPECCQGLTSSQKSCQTKAAVAVELHDLKYGLNFASIFLHIYMWTHRSPIGSSAGCISNWSLLELLFLFVRRGLQTALSTVSQYILKTQSPSQLAVSEEYEVW